ncbi:MAG TPA: Nif11-like leader peptide family natural product precursor [Pseudonocardiaceae bacterium]|nr:Nif11-like leader peptide family natural product precursor [Pseudonocardiaceae bacterium]
MSIDSCTAFLEQTQREPDLRRLLRATTDIRELIVLGRKHGYSFDVDDLVAASTALATPPAPTQSSDAVAKTAETTICHYEFDLHDLPELRPILTELPHLTIKPPTVDLDLFRAAFRRDDLAWVWMSPAASEFPRRYQDVMAPPWSRGEGEPDRRDFHLVNLDQHVDHPLYERYFEAKARTVTHLERAFGSEVQFSGSMWYPPFAYRLWHTNETQPGWRMYLIDFDEEIPPSDTKSFFRYLNPHTKEIVTLRDRPGMLRLFKVEQHKDRLFWHCIVNGADRNRWSFGFVVPDDWMSRLPRNSTVKG